jgi:abortive infection bacteriophage resistance protein
LGYINPANFRPSHDHLNFLAAFDKEIKRNRSGAPFVQHHIQKYGGDFPIWAAVELFSFGMTSKFYYGMSAADQKAIAREGFCTSYKNLGNWLHCLTNLRNICAHYGRLYYRILPINPTTVNAAGKTRVFDYALVLKQLSEPSYWNRFRLELSELIREFYEDIYLPHIGFPPNWWDLLN